MELTNDGAVWGLGVFAGPVLFTIGWIYASGTAGATTHLVAARAGRIVVDTMVIGAARLVAKQRAEARPT